MGIQSAKNRYLEVLTSIGRAAIHSVFPDEFEYYGMMLELRNSDNKIEEAFIFPILPRELSISNNNITNIKKTALGIVSLTTHTFTPVDISFSGNFGRKFKILLADTIIGGTGIALKLGKNKKLEFDATVKTGYGTTKVLESLIKGATDLDSKGLPKRLFWYNLSFNQVFLVEPMSWTFSQSLETSNMMWNYEMKFRAIAPATEIIDTKSSITKLLLLDNMSKLVNTTAAIIQQNLDIAKNIGLNRLDKTLGTDQVDKFKFSEIGRRG